MLPERIVTEWTPSRFLFPIGRLIATLHRQREEPARVDTRVHLTAQRSHSARESEAVSLLIFMVMILEIIGLAWLSESAVVRAITIVVAPVVAGLINTLQITFCWLVFELLRALRIVRLTDAQMRNPAHLATITLVAMAGFLVQTPPSLVASWAWMGFLALNLVAAMLLPFARLFMTSDRR